MKTHYVLIDYENVQPEMASLLAPECFRILVFVGASQSKVDFELADTLARKANGSCFIKASGNGSNALDFHIAYYLGRLAAREPDAYFHVISKDKGMDPVIDHVRQSGIHAARRVSVRDIEIVKQPAQIMEEDEQLSTVIEYLIRRGAQRPASRRTLIGSISALFQPKLDQAAVEALLSKLQAEGIFFLDGEKPTYALPE